MNDIWETGDLPSIWKLANVIPIPKPKFLKKNKIQFSFFFLLFKFLKFRMVIFGGRVF
jgi:hypothetical protein